MELDQLLELSVATQNGCVTTGGNKDVGILDIRYIVINLFEWELSSHFQNVIYESGVVRI